MTDLWTANLRALRGRPDGAAAELVKALEGLGPSADAGLRSKQGTPVPWVDEGGRKRSLISVYDPEQEARRWAEGCGGGTIAVLGAGGQRAAEALENQRVRLAFWVEPRLPVWRSLFTFDDWSAVAARDDWVPVWDSAEVFGSRLLARYHPLWDGAFRTLTWRAAGEPEGGWEPYLATARATLDQVAGDASTQARFGERWYRNMLRNLRALAPAKLAPCPGARVVVAGAGPSLEDALEEPSNRRWLAGRRDHGGRLFAADTAFPALTARGVVPDAVFVLDGQLATYHHFSGSLPPEVPLVADLASIPLLGRLDRPVVRYLSAHPFGPVVRRYFPELPGLDGSLGNVSGLARQTAWSLGARQVDTWGVDFGYRRGQAYARGAYPFVLAGRKAGRLAPSETRLTGGDYGAAGRQSERRADGLWSSTPLLRSYRGLWEAEKPRPGRVELGHRGVEGRWEAFADDWRRRLEALPLPTSAVMTTRVRALPEGTREDWRALWPLALALHRQGVPEGDLPAETRRRALELLEV